MILGKKQQYLLVAVLILKIKVLNEMNKQTEINFKLNVIFFLVSSGYGQGKIATVKSIQQSSEIV